MIQCKNSGISESFDIIVRNFCPSNYEQGLQKIKVACLGGLKATYLTRQAWTACNSRKRHYAPFSALRIKPYDRNIFLHTDHCKRQHNFAMQIITKH